MTFLIGKGTTPLSPYWQNAPPLHSFQGHTPAPSLPPKKM